MIVISFVEENWKLFQMSQQFPFLSLSLFSLRFYSFVCLSRSLCFLNCFPHCVDNNLHKIPSRKHIVLDPRLRNLLYSKTPISLQCWATKREPLQAFRLIYWRRQSNHGFLLEREPRQLIKYFIKEQNHLDHICKKLLFLNLLQSWPREAR